MDQKVKHYNYNERRVINNKIEKMTLENNRENLLEIGRLIVENYDIDKITNKSNGMWLDFNKVNNTLVYKIDMYLRSLDRELNDTIDSDSAEQIYVPYYVDAINLNNTDGPKLTNYEKNLIKMYRNSTDELKPLDVQYTDSDKKDDRCHNNV